MLILSRKKNQAIHIGDNIVITILDVAGDNVKIGIEAPKNIQVYRSEVFKAIEEENKKAALAKAAPEDLAKLLEDFSS
ncbi:carbon storage regulator, CsrA [Desulfotomaculum nigrificans CO-1-SRB]|uniref:Translational regulator CsrA n=1 Tax=Desulfotomaculum nigrificans (strain DSM 14880 / VKM B-2319 / CO-1-SRB) TaxID=868595 RepID=F6B819_DESCC|nr:carbon storage regulator CsrA [Desulfotomaculum nigrificans]AEF94656.1 carbon storage regulator, CsrA [Desulfotomaculum nigrificans CO-1-SRB]